jgi:predicted SnoaL-like aldol condensation-catalyzing enzyme
MATTVDQELHQYLTQMNEEEKKSVLQMLKTLLKGRTQSADRASIESYNQEIDEALDQAAAGNYISQEEMEKRAAEW